MAPTWTDSPVIPGGTRIRTVHINELRRAVDNHRLSLGLQPMAWTNNPITISTPIRAVHFTELRGAIQTLWNVHEQGNLPNWTAGSAPSTSRTIRAVDMNDLRIWFDGTDPLDPTTAINVDPENTSSRPPSLSNLQLAKFQGVRLVSKNNPTVNSYISCMLSHDIGVVSVIEDPRSISYYPSDGRVVLQIGNEPDVNSHPIHMPADVYAGHFATWRSTVTGRYMFTAGFGAGDPEYYWTFLFALLTTYPSVPLPNAVAVHMYGADCIDAASFVRKWKALPNSDPRYEAINDTLQGLELIVTEWNTVGDQQGHVERIASAQHALAGPTSGVAKGWNSWFPWTTAMEPTTPGLVDENGASQPQCTALVVNAIGGSCAFIAENVLHGCS